MAQFDRKNLRSVNGHTKTIDTTYHDTTEKVGAATIDAKTDLNRWRLLDEEGRQTWHYLESEEEIKEWPQSIVDRHHLGLPLVSL